MLKTINTLLGYLVALLFSYAFYIIVQDFQSFQVKLLQSELINNDYVTVLGYGIPIIEIIIAMCILFNLKRNLFLNISLVTLVVFTIYLFAINQYSLFNGCSCGGVFESVTYFQHLIINIVFIVINVLAIVTLRDDDTDELQMQNTHSIA